jgi:hypothetical protein
MDHLDPEDREPQKMKKCPAGDASPCFDLRPGELLLAEGVDGTLLTAPG